MSGEREQGELYTGPIDFDKAFAEDYQRKRARTERIKKEEREEETRSAVAAFGGDLGRAFFNYAVDVTNADYSGEGIGGKDKIVGRRDVFVQALADKLTTGKREDTVLALTALLAAVDNRAQAIVRSIRNYGPSGA